MNMTRRGVLALVAAVSVFTAGIGWVLGQRIKSPAEIAAETSAPEPSLITVPVELREVSSRVVIRGTVVSSEETPIEIAGASEGSPVVTRMPKAVDDQLAEGEVVIEITGRPVIALQGNLPVYRSMGPSSEGPDVEQLETALLRLGYDPGIVDGVYTSSTASAVDSLYRAVGYKPAGPTPDEDAALDAARDRVTQAQRQVDQAGSSGSSGVPESVRLDADQQVELAERMLADAIAAKDAGLVEQRQAVTAAGNDLTAAQTALTTAQNRLTAAQGGAHPDTGQPPTAEELAVLQTAVDDAAAQVQDATTALDQAKAAEAEAEAGAAVDLDRAIQDAETAVAIAKASRSETFASYTDSSGATDGGASLQDTRKELADARADLADLQASTGVSFPAFELVFIPTLPRRVQAVSVSLGSAAQGAVMSVTGTSTVIQSAVSSADRRLLVEGLDAVVEDDELGLRADATVSFLADDPGGPDLPDDRYAMRLVPVGDLPEEAYYQSLRVTIPISSTGGEVLAVPLAAVSAGADGGSRVEVQDPDGSTRLVGVTTGLAADGFVEIVLMDETIEAGDRVVVGRDLQLPGSSDGDDGEDEGEASGG